jgi:mRNA-degrading endonuclease RelE of RelBE toxin-antitoxin system
MEHRFALTATALDELKRLDARARRMVTERFSQSLFPLGAHEIRGSQFYEVPVGEYRVIYRLNRTSIDPTYDIIIVDIFPRSEPRKTVKSLTERLELEPLVVDPDLQDTR